jgi:hypothetical protein
MTLKFETEFPKALKNKGFPMIDKVKNIDGVAPIRG